MTVQVDSGPGPGLYQSTRFTATVNGSASHTYGYARTTTMATAVWAYGESVEESWIQFKADQTVQVTITRLAGSITSYTIYPKNVELSAALSAGKLTIQVPQNTRLYLELNGDRKHALMVFSAPLPAAVPAVKTDWTTLTPKTVSAIDYAVTNFITTSAAHGFVDGQRVHITSSGAYPTASGGDLTALDTYFIRDSTPTTFKLARTSGGAQIDLTSAGSGTVTVQTAQWTDTTHALYFPAGVHTIGRAFYVATNTRLYLDRGAVVIGCIWSSDQTGVTVDGSGTLSGAFSVWEVPAVLTSFYSQVKFSMFLGSAEAPFIGAATNVVRGITVVAAPWYINFRYATEWTNVHVVSPWNWNADGFSPIRNDSTADSTGLVEDCFAYLGDDGLKAPGDSFSPSHVTFRRNFIIVSATAAIQLSYFREKWTSSEPAHPPHYAVYEDTDVLHLGLGDIESGESGFVAGQTSIIRCWVSSRQSEYRTGRNHITFTRLRVWGPHRGRFCTIEVLYYPYTDPGVDLTLGEFGQIGFFTFNGVQLEELPLQIGTIDAVNWWNAPHDIAFTNVTVGGVRLSHRTFSQLVEVGARAYRVFVEDVLMTSAVDLCNRALANIGQRPTITSIAPPDSTYEAQLCAAFFAPTMNTVLERAEWSFMLTRIALTPVDSGEDSDIDAWAYAYQIPAGMLKAIAVVQPGMTADYTLDGTVVPQEFVIERHSTGDLCIYTNVEDAVLRYSVYVTDPNLLPPTLQEGLAWLLASRLAGPLLKGDVGVTAALNALRMAETYLSRASTVSGEQREVKPARLPSSIAAR